MSLLTTVSVAVIGVLFFGCLLVFQQWRSAFLKFGEQVNIIAFLEKDAEVETKDKIFSSVCKEDYVQSCEFRSAERAQEIFLKDYPELKLAVDQLNGDPFLASVHVQFKPTEQQGSAMTLSSLQLNKIPGIEHIEDSRTWASLWERSIIVLHEFFLASGILLAAATLFLLFSTISIVIHHRKNEIEILNLVGATDFGISIPFIVQGITQVLVGLGLSLLAIFFLTMKARLYLQQQFAGAFFSDLQLFSWPQIAMFLGVSSLLGAFGAWIAVRRYLKGI